MKKDEITRLEEKVAKDPKSTLFVRLSEEYRKAGRLDEAIEVLKKGLEAQPAYMSARVALGRIYLEKGMVDEARATFEQVVEAIPDNLFARQRLADIYQEQGELELARQQVEEIIRLNPTVFDGERFRNDLGPRLVSSGWSQSASGGGGGPEPGAEADGSGEGLRIPESAPLGVPSFDARQERDAASEAEEESAEEPAGEAASGPEAVAAPEEEGERGEGRSGDGGTEEEPGPEARAQDILTESMAAIYIEQGHYEKALDVYERLCGRDPENRKLLQQISDLKMLIELDRQRRNRLNEQRREMLVGRLNAFLGRVKRWSGGTS